MKERTSSATKDRTFDADGYIQRAGCLCFKTDSEKEVCVFSEHLKSGYIGYYTTLLLYMTQKLCRSKTSLISFSESWGI